jgi:sorbitol-specific phosphotransferase system component IIA
MLTLTQTIAVKGDVLVQDLGGELVLLNLENEEYFGLDDVGSAMWSALKELGSLQLAYNRLLEKYEVEPEVLERDFLELVEQWVQHDLVEVVDS